MIDIKLAFMGCIDPWQKLFVLGLNKGCGSVILAEKHENRQASLDVIPLIEYRLQNFCKLPKNCSKSWFMYNQRLSWKL